VGPTIQDNFMGGKDFEETRNKLGILFHEKWKQIVVYSSPLLFFRCHRLNSFVYLSSCKFLMNAMVLNHQVHMYFLV
jgi:hypothetical protein